MKLLSSGNLVAAFVAYISYTVYINVSWYQLKTAYTGVGRLLSMPQEDIDKCIEAYKYLQVVSVNNDSDTAVETEHVRAYYNVLNEVLSIADIEKMYIPPQLDARKGLFENQLLWEQHVFGTLNHSLAVGRGSKVLDIGCGRGRIAHYLATLHGVKVSGFNIDANQVENAKEYAAETKMDHLLDFKVGDHHLRFDYPDNSFDGAYSFQAIWPFFKISELDFTAKEIARVLKPGGVYTCGEYLLTPHFDWENDEHRDLHKVFLPTLAATQSNYPADVTAAFERAGLKVILSAPSRAPAWPLTDQKTDLFLMFRFIVVGLTKIGISPVWVETLINNLLLGGQAWVAAEKMKIADLNWQIIVQKPL